MKIKQWAILVFLFLGFHGFSVAQVLEKKISLHYKRTPLSQVLNDLKTYHQINFSYVNDFISLNKQVSIRITNQPVQTVLNQLFKKTDIIYQLVGNQVVLRKNANVGSKFTQTAITQTIRGVVLDKQLQMPLPGANIILANLEPFRGTATDASGNFRLEKVPVGRQDIKISYIGYKDLFISNILVNSGKEVVLTVALEEQMIQNKTVVITAQKDKSRAYNELVVNSVVSLRPDDINRFAGSRQDPLRMAGNYAGVVCGDGQVNHIVVRGNSSRGLLWRMEGADIANPNHFTFVAATGGGFSVINNNLLSSSDFLTGAFPAEYGNKVSSVMDVQLRKGNDEKQEHTFQIGLNGLEYVVEGPLSRKNGSSYLASVRAFDFKPLEKLGVDLSLTGRPHFIDGTFKIHLPTQKMGTFSIWGIGGESSINSIESKRDSSFWANPGYATDEISTSDMFATGISHTYLFNINTSGKLILSSTGGNYAEELKYVADKQTIRTISKYRGKEVHYMASYTLTHKAGTKHLFKTGISYKLLYYKQLGLFRENDSTLVNFMDRKGNTSLLQSFLHWQFRVNEKLDIHSGIYAQLFTLNQTKAVEPRFSVSYQLTKKQRLSFSYGLHSQIHPLQYYFVQFKRVQTNSYDLSNLNLDVMRSHHWVASYTHQFDDKLQLKTEIYYQHLFNVPVSIEKGNEIFSILNTAGDNGLWLSDSLENKGKGKNYGIELTAERYFDKGFYFLATTSLFESTYKDVKGVERHTQFSIGHITNFLAGKEFKLDEEKRKVISVDIKASYLGGKRYIPIDAEASIAAKQLVFDASRAFQAKQKSQFRFDFRLSYNLNLPKATHNIFIAADNLFGARNILSQYWDEKTQRIQASYQIGLFPYFGYRIHF